MLYLLGRAPLGSIKLPRGRCASKSSLVAAQRAIILGVESSCDDTCVAILSSPIVDGRVQLDGTTVLADVAASQHALHTAAGGVVPHFAARAHATQLPRVYAAAVALAESRLGHPLPPITAVAVTCGPGLAGCLKEGLAFARRVVAEPPAQQSLPGAPPLPPPAMLLPVHHLEAHLLVPRLRGATAAAANDCSSEAAADTDPSGAACADAHPVAFPYLVLLVSGGHSSLILARGPGDHATLATTLDDALGEAFDKVARGLQVWRHPPPPPPLQQLVSASPPIVAGLGAAQGPTLRFEAEAEDGGALVLPAAGVQAGAAAAAAAAGGGVHPPQHLGAALEVLACEGDELAYPFAVPLRNTRGAIPCAFSFSGLKSAVFRRLVDGDVRLLAPQQGGGAGGAVIDVASRASVADAAASFQRCAAAHVADQVTRAAAFCALEALLGRGPAVETLVVCGGVAANANLRAAIVGAAPSAGISRVVFPHARLCVDNGVMVAWAGVERLAAAGAGAAVPLSAKGGLTFPWAAVGAEEVAALDFDSGWALGTAPPTRPIAPKEAAAGVTGTT